MNAPRFNSDPGTNKMIDYQVKVLKDGSIALIENGYIDTDQMIESHRQSVELSTLIARYNNGDLSALNQVNGFYADVANAPKTLPEALQIVFNAESAFNQLPVDVKKEFGSDWRQWLADAGTDEWNKVMEKVADVTAPERKEVVEDEQK